MNGNSSEQMQELAKSKQLAVTSDTLRLAETQNLKSDLLRTPNCSQHSAKDLEQTAWIEILSRIIEEANLKLRHKKIKRVPELRTNN